MKLVSFLLAAAMCAMPLAASAQWQWIDKDGRKVFSDQAPPIDIPDKNIVRKPQVRVSTPSAPPVASATPGAPVPRLPGTDKELQDKTQQAKDAEAVKARQELEKVAKVRADNCARAREAKVTMDSGIRMSRTNATGEREVLDDAGRAAELQRIQETIATECRAS